jgi:hypothetical protein
MSKRVFEVEAFTPTATADGAALANGTYMAIGAATSATGLEITEIYQAGQAAASAVNIMVFARDSTLGATPTAIAAPNADGPLIGLAQTLSANMLTFTAATTGPSRSAATTVAKLNMTFNAFGGISKWQANRGEGWQIIGVTASVSESSLSSRTGTAGAMGAHIIYEPF